MGTHPIFESDFDCLTDMPIRPSRSPEKLEMLPQRALIMAPDTRIHELNRRLMSRPAEPDNLWWDSLTTEFFDDEAVLKISCYLEDGLKHFGIGRRLIPRYFRSLFEDGVTDGYFVPRMTKETYLGNTLVAECDMASLVTTHTKPIYGIVTTDGRLSLEFSFEDQMRIRSWHFLIRGAHEMVPKTICSSALSTDGPTAINEICRLVTRSGLTTATLNFLRLCNIMEPMTELFTFHKTFRMEPRECLKNCLYQKWNKIMNPPEGTRDARGKTSRRKRKPSHPPRKGRQAPNDILIAGEPTIMGGLADDDERPITRIENIENQDPQLDNTVKSERD